MSFEQDVEIFHSLRLPLDIDPINGNKLVCWDENLDFTEDPLSDFRADKNPVLRRHK